MNNEESNLLAEAAAGLSLSDIALVGSHFSRPEDFPVADSAHFTQLEKRLIGYVTEERGTQTILLVKLELGVRLVDNDTNDRVFVQIVADYLAVYMVEATLTEAHFKAFSELNSLHNVWPFWRQHVFDIVQRGHLPTIDIPLMYGKKTKREI